jgi:hypothetical protein
LLACIRIGAGPHSDQYGIGAAERTSAITLIGHNLTLQTKEHLISGRCQGVLERRALFVSKFLCINSDSWPDRLTCDPATPHKIQELFLLEFRLIGGDVRTVELDEPVAFEVPLDFFA